MSNRRYIWKSADIIRLVLDGVYGKEVAVKVASFYFGVGVYKTT
ncbi:hypothetical protein [Bacillus sp. AFS059628]|nr:hypothetical protein [Bacillus sp. AFS059628]